MSKLVSFSEYSYILDLKCDVFRSYRLFFHIPSQTYRVFIVFRNQFPKTIDFFKKEVNRRLKLNYIGDSIIHGTFFDDFGLPIIITDFCPGISLSTFIEHLYYQKGPNGIDNTHKHIILFGIARILYEYHKNGEFFGAFDSDLFYLNSEYEPHLKIFYENIDNFRNCHSPYAAPEVIEFGAGTEKSDIYSFGLIVYHLIFGFDIRRPVRLRDDNPYSSLVLSCMSLSPSSRPDSSEILQILRGQFNIDNERFQQYIHQIDSFPSCNGSVENLKKMAKLGYELPNVIIRAQTNDKKQPGSYSPLIYSIGAAGAVGMGIYLLKRFRR